ncbi:MAG TPA: cation:proton antiporter [Methylophilaceae bacterium]|nr:cation:proton antiporter [Methylophilaceae bacterium]
MPGTLQTILILLTCAVFAVALFRVLRLPTMLAYFLIGVLLGPHTFGFLPDSEANRELAEFGIVFLMFSIGLEFSLPQLYAMRTTVFGLGGAQVAITTLVVMSGAMALGVDWGAALVLAGAMGMSSTAIVSKMLVEKVELSSRHGRLAVGVLLFQDLAVVPLLIMIPALAAPAEVMATTLGLSLLKAAITLSILLVFGKRLINPWFELVARQQSRELFVMNVLMVTLLLAFVTSLAGLSYALGAFVAGMLISETRYRYQVEADIAPFRDILLGLFFITVGMMLDIRALIANIEWVLLLLVLIVFLKALIITQLARVFRHETGVAIRTGILLAQAGEFSFVIMAHGVGNGVLSGTLFQVVLAASLLSMVVAPFIIQHNGWFASRLSRSYESNRDRKINEIESIGQELKDHVIICGFGRSGQYLSRFLHEEDIPFIALDIDPSRVREAASAGENVVYGDAGRRVVLKAAGAERAKAVVISYADQHASMKVLHVVQENYPQLPVIVRTVDDSNMEKFVDAGAAEVVPEVLEGSLMLASHALVMMGVPLSRVVKRIRHFREERYQMFRGFFHGLSDYDLDARDEDQVRLRSVALPAGAYACRMRLKDLDMTQHKVQVKSIRRPNTKGLSPAPEVVLAEGDMVVLQGTPDNLSSAATFLLTGK